MKSFPKDIVCTHESLSSALWLGTTCGTPPQLAAAGPKFSPSKQRRTAATCFVLQREGKRDDVGTVIAQTFRADRSLGEEASYQQCVAASLNGVAVSRVSFNVSSIANTLRALLVEARSWHGALKAM